LRALGKSFRERYERTVSTTGWKIEIVTDKHTARDPAPRAEVANAHEWAIADEWIIMEEWTIVKEWAIMEEWMIMEEWTIVEE
jgi:hypothetical protein